MERLNQKRTLNATILERTEIPTAPVEDVLASDTSPNDVEWRVVSATGRFLADKSVTIINRSQDGTAGFTPLTPLELSNGGVIYVNRGFVPLNQSFAEVPSDVVSVLGYLRPSQKRGSFGAIDSADSSTTEFHRIDLELISRQLTTPSLPMYLQLIEQSPPVKDQWPLPATLPSLDEGPHFSYAMQWWFFSLVAITGWIVVVRRALKHSATEHSVPN